MRRVLCLVALVVGLPLATHTSRAKAATQITETGYVTVRDGTRIGALTDLLVLA